MPKKNANGALGFLAGALGGALGTVALNLLQRSSLRATDVVERRVGAGKTYTDQQKQLVSMFEQAHNRTADVVTKAAGIELTPSQRQVAAPVTEFAFGILCAGIYGAVAEYLPAITAGVGGVYGAVLFAGASEIVLPAIEFVPAPQQRTPVQHAGGLAGNLLYGVVTEQVRRLLR